MQALARPRRGVTAAGSARSACTKVPCASAKRPPASRAAPCCSAASAAAFMVPAGARSRGDQEVAADAGAEVVDAVQELREVGVQAVGEDLVDVAVLQLGAQAAGAPLRFGRLVVR